MAAPFTKEVISERYTASIKARVVRTTKTANERGYFDEGPVTDNDLLIELDLTAKSLEELKLKLINHINLMEE